MMTIVFLLGLNMNMNGDADNPNQWLQTQWIERWECDEDCSRRIRDTSANDYARKGSEHSYNERYQNIGCQNLFLINNHSP